MRANFVLSGVATGIRRNADDDDRARAQHAIALAFVGAALLANTEITKFKNAYEGKINVSVYSVPTLHDKDAELQAQDDARRDGGDPRSSSTSDPLVNSASYVSEEEAVRARQASRCRRSRSS